MKTQIFGALICLLLLSNSAMGISQVEKSYIERMVNGGSSSVRSVASSLVNIQGLDKKVYDVAAEVLLRDYRNAGAQNADIDAMAWLTKALVASKDSCYVTVLEEIKNNASHPKLRKYGKSTAKKLKKGATKSSPAYTKGMVKLSKYKRSKNSSNIGRAKQGKQPISEIKIGMSSSDVYSIAGHPDYETVNATGKAFNPFNFSGKGNLKTQALYKGQGRVVMENSSSYTHGKRVVEVILDIYESGYP